MPTIPRRKRRSTSNVDATAILDAAIQEFVRALAGPILTAGLTPDAFCEIAKAAFVDYSAHECRFANGRVNESRVAVMTSLSRQEVARLRNKLTRQPSDRRKARVNRILDGWNSDPRFSVAFGRPRPLGMRSDNRSFHALVKRYAGDVPARAVLEELKRTGAVRITNRGAMLTKAQRYPAESLAKRLRILGPRLASAVRTLASSGTQGAGQPFLATVRVFDDVHAKLARSKIEKILNASFESIESLNAAGRSGKRSRTQTRELSVLAFLDILEPTNKHDVP